MSEQSRKARSWKKKILIGICSLVVLLLVLLIGGYIFVNSLLDNIQRVEPMDTTPVEEQMTVEDPTDTVPLIERMEMIPTGKDVINILLVGQDRRSGTKRENTDAMILCTINKNQKTLTMTSFMRDMWVYIPEYYNNRINVPYLLGGFELLNETLSYNFGVTADYNVEIDFSGFMTAVDMVGGIDIELTAAEAKYLNRRGNWDVEEDCDWELTEGVNHLTGSQALAYSRIRDIGDDFGRTSRQRTVLTVLIEKAKGLDLLQMYELVKEIFPLLRTDMTNPQIMGIVAEVLPMLNDMEVISQRIPMDGEWSYGIRSGADVIVLTPDNFEANKELLAETMK